MTIKPGRAAPIPGQPTTYLGKHDMAGWWSWSEEAELPRIEVFRPFIKSGDVVFDIGANRGRKTFLMRKLGAKVIAVEPLFAFGDEFVPEFRWKFGADRMVVPIARAVSPERSVTIQVNRFMPWISSIDEKWMTESKHAAKYGESYYRPGSLVPRQVPTITLDGLVSIYGVPRFMKVDVEGAEDSVIATLSTPVPALNMEFHQDWLPVAAMEHMDAMESYRWNFSYNTTGKFALRKWLGRRQLVNYLRRNLTEKGRGSWGDIYGRMD